ncbi:spondin-1-like isoform X2 [Ctenocephalides felis]|uniref:spondin-1-like isoform X2 n=1 Tax=Ctenocephalides felis TaxID=7515 RepID=UPI000E6E13A0|nr:spondin-1-like isoform X2 [Ctenocephalides felis]
MPKSEIQVMWTAPPAGSGCVVFRATVLEVRDVWYMDDGPLSRTLCEDSQDSLDLQPSVVDPCEACDEAKYEVTFEGLWSRHTHPKDFPSNGWLTRFSDVIGASHTVDYRFWEYGQPASEGLRQVAEHGATRMLESELKAESEHIRTIIKARGISYPNVTGKTFAVFRVDKRHHLVSLVSMIFPSPDWIVGVSGLELCARNGSWIESRVLNLYPWDAGTDSGPSYISPDQPTNPRDVIRRIRANYPNDPRSPFYDPSGGEMKPLARLHLARQRLYEKACENSVDNIPEEDDDPSGACAVTSWLPWSECSVTCGKGVRRRQRYYRDEAKAEIMSCKRKLTDRNSCWVQDCSNEGGVAQSNHLQQSLEADDEYSTGECALTPWSDWSSCSAKCGPGNKMRSRRYRRRGAMKHCRAGKPRPPSLQQTDVCTGEEKDCDPPEGTLEVPPGCPMTMWSTWSPCSATCGKGHRMRSRYPIAPTEQLRNFYKRGLTHQYRAQHWDQNSNEANYDETPQDEDNDQDNDEDEEDEISVAACEGVLRVQQVTCVAPIASCESLPPHLKEPCTLPLDTGPCRAPGVERWYFNSERQSCEPFMYSGCYGNNNNFKNKEQCEEVCPKGPDVNLFGDLSSDSQKKERRLYGPVQGTQLTGDGTLTGYDKSPLYLESKQPPGVLKCLVTKWSPWSECSVTCGRGHKQKTRYITRHPVNGGKQCPSKLLKRRTCRRPPCPNGEGARESGENKDLMPTWGPANTHDNRTHNI